MSDSRLKHELRCLVLLSLEGEATEQQYQRLNELLKSSQEYFNYYLDLIEIHQAIQSCNWQIEYENVYSLNRALEEFAIYENNAPEIEITQEEPPKELIQKVVYPPREKVRMTKFQKFTLAASAAIVFFFAYLSLIPQKSYSVKVATLTDSINASWADNVSMQKGTRLMNDGQAYMLREGIVKLEFDSHVTAVIEAPAEFQIQAQDRIGLRYGKVYSIVSSEGRGFSVYTPNAKIIDMGTEFGVQAEIDGDTQLQVFKGETMLLFGTDDSKSNMKVGKGGAKKISANTHEVTDIPYDKTRFVHQIDSRNNFIWKGEKRIDLADIVDGGNGFGTGQKGFCIMPDTGRFTVIEKSLLGADPSGVTKLQQSYMRAVPDLPAVDCVIVPGYLASGDLPLSTTGLSIPDFPELTGSLRWRIQTQPYYKEGPVILNGTRYGVDEHPAILIHASCGITFDLDAIRQAIPGLSIVSFKALCGVNESSIDHNFDPERTADFRILLDGREVLYQSVQHIKNNAVPVEIDLIEGAPRFMTLLVTSGEQSNDLDHCVFGVPELILEGQ